MGLDPLQPFTIKTVIKKNDQWDPYLGNMGFIPHTVKKWVQNNLDDERKHKVKHILCDIAKVIMEGRKEGKKETWLPTFVGLMTQAPKEKPKSSLWWLGVVVVLCGIMLFASVFPYFYVSLHDGFGYVT